MNLDYIKPSVKRQQEAGTYGHEPRQLKYRFFGVPGLTLAALVIQLRFLRARCLELVKALSLPTPYVLQ